MRYYHPIMSVIILINKINMLQNVENEDETEEKQMDVNRLIIQDKLVSYKWEVFNAHWKSGNCIILVCNSYMGQFIKNKFLTNKTNLMLSNMENLLSEFESMFEAFMNRENISRSEWTCAINSTIKIVNDFQNLVSLFRFSSNDVNNKEEVFSVEDVIKTVTENLAVFSVNSESEFMINFEQGVPDLVYGDMINFRQVITTLTNFANTQRAKDKSAILYLRLVEIDNKRRYIIELKITIPIMDELDVNKLKIIFDNDKLDLDFLLKFKDDLHKYDFGLLICSYLVKQWEGTINITEQNDENNKKLIITLRFPFEPKNPYGTGNLNQTLQKNTIFLARDHNRRELEAIEESKKGSNDDLNMTRRNIR